MDWTQVEERLVEDDRNKWDRKAASAELRISTSYGLLDVGNADRAGPVYTLGTRHEPDVSAAGHSRAHYRQLPAQLRAMVDNYDFDRLDDSAFFSRQERVVPGFSFG
jgi:hypothetical protein